MEESFGEKLESVVGQLFFFKVGALPMMDSENLKKKVGEVV